MDEARRALRRGEGLYTNGASRAARCDCRLLGLLIRNSVIKRNETMEENLQRRTWFYIP